MLYFQTDWSRGATSFLPRLCLALICCFFLGSLGFDQAWAGSNEQFPAYSNGRRNLTNDWTEGGGARLQWNVPITPRQVRLAGMSFADPAAVPLLCTDCPDVKKPVRRYKKRKAKRPRQKQAQVASTKKRQNEKAKPKENLKERAKEKPVTQARTKQTDKQSLPRVSMQPAGSIKERLQ